MFKSLFAAALIFVSGAGCVLAEEVKGTFKSYENGVVTVTVGNKEMTFQVQRDTAAVNGGKEVAGASERTRVLVEGNGKDVTITYFQFSQRTNRHVASVISISSSPAIVADRERKVVREPQSEQTKDEVLVSGPVPAALLMTNGETRFVTLISLSHTQGTSAMKYSSGETVVASGEVRGQEIRAVRVQKGIFFRDAQDTKFTFYTNEQMFDYARAQKPSREPMAKTGGSNASKTAAVLGFAYLAYKGFEKLGQWSSSSSDSDSDARRTYSEAFVTKRGVVLDEKGKPWHGKMHFIYNDILSTSSRAFSTKPDGSYEFEVGKDIFLKGVVFEKSNTDSRLGYNPVTRTFSKPLSMKWDQMPTLIGPK